jgi:hypothetical protein
MFNTEIIECAKGCPGKVAEFRMIALCLKLTKDGYGNDDFMFFKSFHRPGICQQY